jgi:putative oxidoreductase
MGDCQSLYSAGMTSPDSRRPRGNAVFWGLRALFAVAFLIPALRKLIGVDESVQLFDELGFGQWLRYAVGLLELALTVGLLIPRVSGIAALGIVATMVGATFTEIFVESGRWWLPVAYGAVAALIAWYRRADLTPLLRLRPRPAA